MLSFQTLPRNSFKGTCTGCGHYRVDLQRGRPARYVPGRWSGSGFCTDCRDYFARTVGWVTERDDSPALPALADAITQLAHRVTTLERDRRGRR